MKFDTSHSNLEDIERHVIRKGLAQLPEDGLTKIIDHIDAGKPLLLDGPVMRPAKDGNGNTY